MELMKLIELTQSIEPLEVAIYFLLRHCWVSVKKILQRTWKLQEGNIKYYIILLENLKIG